MSKELNEQLYRAIRGRNHELAAQLAKEDVDPNTLIPKELLAESALMTDEDESLFYVALMCCVGPDVLKNILEKTSDKTIQRALFKASSDPNLTLEQVDIILKVLAKRPVNLNEKFKDGNTYLHAALYSGNLWLFDLFCEKGASATQENMNGESVLDIAIKLGKFDTVDAILHNTTSAQSPLTPKQLEDVQEKLKEQPTLLNLLRQKYGLSVAAPQDTPLQRGLFVFGLLMALVGFVIGFIPFPIIPQIVGGITAVLGGILVVSSRYVYVKPKLNTTKTLAEKQPMSEKVEENIKETSLEARTRVDEVVDVRVEQTPITKDKLQESTSVNQPKQESRADGEQETVTISYDKASVRQDLEKSGFSEKEIAEVIELIEAGDSEQESIAPKTTSSTQAEPEDTEIQTPHLDLFGHMTDQQKREFVDNSIKAIPKNRRGQREIDSLLSGLEHSPRKDDASQISYAKSIMQNHSPVFSKDTSDVHKTETEEEQSEQTPSKK